MSRKTVKELNIEFINLSERVKQLEEASNNGNSEEKEASTNGKIQEIEVILKEYDKKINHLDKELKESNAGETSKKEYKEKCKACGKEFETIAHIRDHLKEHKGVHDLQDL